MFDTPGLCEMIAGFMLLLSVVRIRSFLRQNHDEEHMDTGALCRHATSFGLYLVAVTVYYSTYTVYTFHPDTDPTKPSTRFLIF